MCIFVFVYMPCVCSCSWRPEGGVASFGAGVTSDYEPPTAPNFIFIYVCIYTYATCVKGYKRALDPQDLMDPGESDSCEMPDKGTGNKILVTLEEQQVL